MKMLKKVLIIAILPMLLAVNANAWGKKEQGFLLGVGSAWLASSIFSSSGNSRYYNNGYYDRYYGSRYHNGYYDGRYYGNGYYKPSVQYVKPQVTIVESPRGESIVVDPKKSHRQQKDHVYINKINPNDTVVIEYSDGTKTIIQGR